MPAVAVPERFAAAAAELFPAAGEPVVLGVSGGSDSMALWDLARRDGRWPLVVCHLDHGLRDDAGADLETIRAFAARAPEGQRLWTRGVDCVALASGRGIGLEAAGREARYRCYRAAAAAAGAGIVALAHQRDDQAETLVMHLLRGAGPIGGLGMPARRPIAAGVEVVRPLLACSRDELRAYAGGRALPWREDRSNTDCRFFRNRIRHRVLPTFETGRPGFTAALLARASARAGSVRRELAAARAVLGRARRGDLVRLAELREQDSARRLLAWRELCRELGLPLARRHLRRLDDLAAGRPGRRFALGGLLFRREGDALAWRPAAAEPAAGPARRAVRVPGSYPGPTGSLDLREAPAPADPVCGERTAWLDARSLRGPLWWGPAEPGQRFRPLGLSGHKTVRAFLADRGVPAERRPAWPVLGDASGPLWIAGHGIAERARIVPGVGGRAVLARLVPPALP